MTDPERILRIIFRITLVTLPWILEAAALHAAEKVPVPSADAQNGAMALVEDVYGEEYAKAESAEQKTALAEKILQTAKQTDPGTANHYSLLQVAWNVATQAGDAKLALQITDEMARAYEFNALSAKVATVKTTDGLVRTSAQRTALATVTFDLVDEAVAEDNYESATELNGIALAAARKSRDWQLVKRIVAREKELKEAAEAYADVQAALAILEAKPTDPAANQAAGEYFCFVQGDWGKGIPMLALGDDAALKDLAVKELKGAASPDAQVALGDRWWDLAQTKEDGARDLLLLRAGFWYQQAQPRVASVLIKARVEKRMAEIVKIGRPIPEGSIRPTPSREMTVKGWDISEVQPRATLKSHTGQVRTIAVGPDSSILASGGRDRTVKLWDVATGKLRQNVTGHRSWLHSVAFSPDGSFLASGSDDNTVKLWDMRTGLTRWTLQGHSAGVSSVAFSPDGSILASGSYDNTVRLWDLDKGQARGMLQHSVGVSSVAFSPDGSTLACGDADTMLRLWDVATGQLRCTLQGHTDGVCSIAFSPDGSILASGSRDATVRLWAPEDH